MACLDPSPPVPVSQWFAEGETTAKQGLRVAKERVQSFERLSVRRTEQGSFHGRQMSSRKQREMESESLKASPEMGSTPSSGTCNWKLTY